MKLHRALWLAAAVAIAASCGDDGSSSDAGEDGGNLQPDGSTSQPECGNDVAEGGELCDGRDLNGETCTSATHGVMTGGRLSCGAKCTFDVTQCTGEDSGIDEDDGGLGGTGG